MMSSASASYQDGEELEPRELIPQLCRLFYGFVDFLIIKFWFTLLTANGSNFIGETKLLIFING